MVSNLTWENLNSIFVVYLKKKFYNRRLISVELCKALQYQFQSEISFMYLIPQSSQKVFICFIILDNLLFLLVQLPLNIVNRFQTFILVQTKAQKNIKNHWLLLSVLISDKQTVLAHFYPVLNQNIRSRNTLF